MENKKVLAFDLGRVIFDFDYNIALDKIKDKIAVPVEKVIRELLDNDFGLSFERGDIGPEEFYHRFKDAFKADFSYDYFIDVWSGIFSPMNDTIGLAKRLKGKYPLYLISNINVLHFEYLLRKYREVFSLFNRLILSFEVKSVKPEEKIYRALKDASGAAFEDIIYIDDRQDLIAKAKSFKLQCLRFIDFNRLLQDLKGLGIRTS